MAKPLAPPPRERSAHRDHHGTRRSLPLNVVPTVPPLVLGLDRTDVVFVIRRRVRLGRAVRASVAHNTPPAISIRIAAVNRTAAPNSNATDQFTHRARFSAS